MSVGEAIVVGLLGLLLLGLLVGFAWILIRKVLPGIQCGSGADHSTALDPGTETSWALPDEEEWDGFVELEVTTPSRLPSLLAIVEAISRAKTEAYQPELDPAAFDHLLDDAAREWFVVSAARSGFSYASALYMIGICEYTTMRVRPLEKGRMRIIYFPMAGPYGGPESLIAFVEAFGQTVTARGL